MKAAILAFAMTACHAPSVVVVDPPADAGPGCQAADCACASLCLLGCEECKPNCQASIDHVLRSRISHFDTRCVGSATSKEQVRLCPMIRCP